MLPAAVVHVLALWCMTFYRFGHLGVGFIWTPQRQLKQREELEGTNKIVTFDTRQMSPQREQDTDAHSKAVQHKSTADCVVRAAQRAVPSSEELARWDDGGMVIRL